MHALTLECCVVLPGVQTPAATLLLCLLTDSVHMPISGETLTIGAERQDY